MGAVRGRQSAGDENGTLITCLRQSVDFDDDVNNNNNNNNNNKTTYKAP